jgi:hypothetical protein
MAASLKGKRTPITTPSYQLSSVDVTPDLPIFSLVTTFKRPPEPGLGSLLFNQQLEKFVFHTEILKSKIK